MKPPRALALAGLSLLLYGILAGFRLGSFDLGVDEGRFGISAMNILSDYRQMAIVSEQPLGTPGWKPYFYPLVLAASLRLGGKSEAALRIVNVVAIALSALCLYYFARGFLPWVGAALVALFLLFNPGSLTYARTVMPEPWVLLPGCAALIAASDFWRRPRLITALAAGVALGVAFLAKLWLVFPFVLACTILLLHRLVLTRDSRIIGLAAVGLFSFLTVGTSHLTLNLFLAPEALTHWSQVYFVHYFATRVSGAAYDPAMWYRPWWFYLAALFKLTAFGLPFVLLGAYHALRNWASPLTWVTASLLTPIPVFSLLKVKQASYIIGVFPAAALLFAIGVLHLWGTRNRIGFAAAAVFSAFTTVLLARAGALAAAEALALVIFYAVSSIVLFIPFLSPRDRQLVAVGAVLVGLLIGDATVIRHTAAFRTHYREISAYFEDRLTPLHPTDQAFVAPEYPSLEFYTFRSGEYWETFYFKKDDAVYLDELKRGARAFYIVDPSGRLYGGRISPARMRALESLAEDVTPEIERALGTRLPVRAFVPRAR